VYIINYYTLIIFQIKPINKGSLMHVVTEAILEANDTDALIESIERAREAVTTTLLIKKILTCGQKLSSKERAIVVDELMEYLGV